MTSRYEQTPIFDNRTELYKDLFDLRSVNFIKQYVTPIFDYPTPQEFASLDISSQTWKRGDKYWKIATDFYGSPDMWWVIAWFNRKPTEAHMKLGDTVLIPQPLERVLFFFGV